MPAAAVGTAQLYRDRLGELTAPGGPVHVHMLRTLMRIDARAKFYLGGVMVGKRTGNLLTSQQPPTLVHVGRNLLGVLQNTARYAAAVHEGSKPHDIRPVNKKALRFPASARNHAAGSGGGRTATGQIVFTRAVRHPGAEGRPFLRAALHEVIGASQIA